MARKGSGVRCATSVKTPPQVIVGCGYPADVIISLSTGSAGKDKASPPVRFRKEGRVAPESSVLDVPRISRVSLYKVCKSRRYKLKLVEVRIASSPSHRYPSLLKWEHWAPNFAVSSQFDSARRAEDANFRKWRHRGARSGLWC